MQKNICNYGKSWKHFTGRRLQVPQKVVQAVERLCMRLGVNVRPHVHSAPGCIEELSERSPAICQGLEIEQNTEGKILPFK